MTGIDARDSERSLDEWLAHIGRERPDNVTRGLAPSRAVAERLDVLPPAPLNIVVAGTNGKGSTAIAAEALLLAQGRRVGTTLSPHLRAFNERIRIDGQAVDNETICMAFSAVESAREDTALSYFEYAILAALWVFQRRAVDVAVLEVGLGGRLDTVNLVDADVAVITSIGLDHQQWLGADREAIAAEKAGIVRPRRPVVFGETDLPAAIAARAEALAAPLWVYGRDFRATPAATSAAATVTAHWRFDGRDRSGPRRFEGLPPPRLAINNVATALQGVLLLPAPAEPLDAGTVAAACAQAVLPGRLQSLRRHARRFVLDVAHNPHAAAFLARQLAALPGAGRTVAIAGFLEDKDVAGIVAALAEPVSQWIFIDTPGERGQAAATACERACSCGIEAVPAGDFDAALQRALAATAADDRILVLGSFAAVEAGYHALVQAGAAA